MSVTKKEGPSIPVPIRLLKILFIHNTLVTYRVPFFRLLNKEFNVRFVFTCLQASGITYGQDYRKLFQELKFKDASICKPLFPNKISFLLEGIPIGLAKHVFTDDFDVLVDNLQGFKIILSLLASKFRRKPLITWTLQWYDFDSSFVGKVKSFVLGAALKQSSAVLVPGVRPSQFVQKFGIDPQRVFIMPNVSVMESNTVAPQDANKLKEYYEVVNKEIILYVGRLVERKGVEYLIKAFSKLKSETDDVVLFIVGKGPLEGKLNDLVNKLSISESVFFIGPLEREEMSVYYYASAVCVVPSITHTKKEPWALVLNEAMQFGKPVIATEAVGAAYELVKNGLNGFLVVQRDEIALYKKLKILTSDEELRSQMGAESKKIIESQYQYSDMLRGFSSALEYVYSREFQHEN